MTGQSGITQHGVQFPTAISQSGELFPEAGEAIPYPLGAQNATGVNWPPAGFSLGSDTFIMTTTPLDSDVPPAQDLEWVQGATKRFTLYVPDVNWTVVDSANEDGPEWEPHTWHAQIRNPYIFWTDAAMRWQPVIGFQYEWWRQHSGVAEFEVTTTLVQSTDLPEPPVDDDPDRYYTKVELVIPAWMSERLRPGSWYHWDMLSRSVVPIANDPADQLDPEVQFWRRGKCRIVTQWTIVGSNYRA